MRIRSFILFLVALFGVQGVLAQDSPQEQPYSWKDINISLITAGPGELLYEAFGHSGVRVRIENTDFDVVYNYGTFDFTQEDFYINFCRGRLNYFLSTVHYYYFERAYQEAHRWLYEQTLDLDSIQTMEIVNFLEWNALSENREYRYHFFFDNCATRIRDIILKAYKIEDFPPVENAPTFRQLIHRYLDAHNWGKYGIDIALGMPTDDKANIFDQMFLPDIMMKEFGNVLHDGKRIVRAEGQLISAGEGIDESTLWFSPLVMNLMLLALGLLVYRSRTWGKVFDVALFTFIGLVGALVVFLWFFTDHTNTQNNLNILWAWPTHLVLAWMLIRRNRSAFERYYWLANACVGMLLLLSWAFLPQDLNECLIPLIITSVLRSLYNYRIR